MRPNQIRTPARDIMGMQRIYPMNSQANSQTFSKAT
jgi:hypothetical protein